MNFLFFSIHTCTHVNRIILCVGRIRNVGHASKGLRNRLGKTGRIDIDKNNKHAELLLSKSRTIIGHRPYLENLDLYRNFYQQKNRGYTEDEFRQVCESIAGVSLDEFFEYVYTVKEIDYSKYFGYAGLAIDTTSEAQPGAWLGIAVKEKNDTLNISGVDWDSPAWHAGIRPRQTLITIDNEPASVKKIETISKEKKAGDIIHLEVAQQNGMKSIPVKLETRFQKSFAISRIARPTTLQTAILNDWLKTKTK